MSKRVDLHLAGVDLGRVLTGPETIHIDVTNGCNTNCITCWDHSPLLAVGRTSAWKRTRVEAAAVEAILDDVLSLGGLEAVIVSGMGEPFTHPDIDRILEAVKARGLHVTVITNLIPADEERVLAIGVDQLLIGIHAASEASYRAFHPSFQADEWRQLHRKLARFAAAGRRYKHVQVICRTNAHELADMVRLADRYAAAQLNFKLASLGGGTEACRITEEQREGLASGSIAEAAEVAAALGVETNLDVFAAQVAAGGEATAPVRDVGCFMGYYYARILVDGTVLYCCHTVVRVGSLAGGARFSELWDGERWRALRERLRGGRYFASCAQCGKLNQNVKLARRFGGAFGERRLLEVTGRRPHPDPLPAGRGGGEVTREPTIEWQVCGVCNYDCSYCIQSPKTRVGHPSPEDVERFLDFFAALPRRFEVKMTGGEPFAFRGFMERIVPGLVERTTHTVSVLTNLSAPLPVLLRFAEMTRGRLGIVSASLHLEFATADAFVRKAAALREAIDPEARLVVNEVLVPGRLEEVAAAKRAVEAAGLRFFPQVMKVGPGIYDYDEGDRARVRALVGIDPGPRRANMAPSYRGRTCWTGVDYFVLTQAGDAWSCRTARRHGEGYLGNALRGTVTLRTEPRPCPYGICPCTVPANRGMIEGVGGDA